MIAALEPELTVQNGVRQHEMAAARGVAEPGFRALR